MTTRVRRPFIVAVCLAIGGCAASSTPSANSPNKAHAEAQDVSIDLSPEGMAATIVAPNDANVKATSRGVELVGGGGFHLLVERGPLDPLAQKGWIVREYGESFRRFIRDRGREVVYETSFAGSPRFHFFVTSHGAPLEYHCKTPDRGVDSLDVVEHMIIACNHVKFRSDIDPAELAAQAANDS